MADDMPDRHEPVKVSEAMREAMREAAGPPAERVTRPSNEHQVTKIVKRRSVPADE